MSTPRGERSPSSLPPLPESPIPATREALADAPRAGPTLLLRSHVHTARVVHASFAAELGLLACVDAHGVLSITCLVEGTCLLVRRFDPDQAPRLAEFAKVAVAPGG